MVALRNYLQTYLTGWRADLDPDWRAFFDGVEPHFPAIPAGLQFDSSHPVIPPRRNVTLPGAPAGAHVFRAFDLINPADVKIVLIGQDPYPRVSRATGRAFEDGAMADWNGVVAVSLQRIVQSAVALRYGRPDFDAPAAGWEVVRSALGRGEIELEPLGSYFDRLQSSGMLFVNAGWTLTRYVPGGGEEQKGHIAMWRPLMQRLLQGLALRDQRPTVFLLLGGFAQKLFAATGVEADARDAGTWHQIRTISHPHPSAIGPKGYLASGNPLKKVNAALAELGLPGMDW